MLAEDKRAGGTDRQIASKRDRWLRLRELKKRQWGLGGKIVADVTSDESDADRSDGERPPEPVGTVPGRGATCQVGRRAGLRPADLTTGGMADDLADDLSPVADTSEGGGSVPRGRSGSRILRTITRSRAMTKVSNILLGGLRKALRSGT